MGWSEGGSIAEPGAERTGVYVCDENERHLCVVKSRSLVFSTICESEPEGKSIDRRARLTNPEQG